MHNQLLSLKEGEFNPEAALLLAKWFDEEAEFIDTALASTFHSSEEGESERNIIALKVRSAANLLRAAADPILLKRILVALDDWTNTHAPEFADEEHLREAQQRIKDNGGTLAYVADLKKEIKERIFA